jgi:hypothetical protein
LCSKWFYRLVCIILQNFSSSKERLKLKQPVKRLVDKILPHWNADGTLFQKLKLTILLNILLIKFSFSGEFKNIEMQRKTCLRLLVVFFSIKLESRWCWHFIWNFIYPRSAFFSEGCGI